MTKKLFFDTETTGLSGNDRICQLSAVKFDMASRQFVGEFNEFINPQFPLSYDAKQVTGLSDEFLADKPIFSEVWPRFCEFAFGQDGVAHNAAFDVRMLNAELQRIQAGVELRQVMATVTCSARLARKVFPGKSVSLDALPELLEVDLPPRAEHDAVDDCRRLALVFAPLMERIGPRLRAQAELMQCLIGADLAPDAPLDAVVDRLCALEEAMEPLLLAQKAAKKLLASHLSGKAYADRRIEVGFKPKSGNMDWDKLKERLPEGFDLEACRGKPPAATMKITYRL